MRAVRAKTSVTKAYGVECAHDAAERARSVFDILWSQDVESVRPDIPQSSLDYVVMSHVLEHLRCPDALLSAVSPLLKPTGLVLVSVPNASYWRLVWNLAVRNEWQYEPHGLMDEAHLRWFTSRSLQRLFNEAGMTLRSFRFGIWGARGRTFDRLTFHLPSRFIAHHIDMAFGLRSTHVPDPERRPEG
jgi:SAM-dependent methyltransferase